MSLITTKYQYLKNSNKVEIMIKINNNKYYFIVY